MSNFNLTSDRLASLIEDGLVLTCDAARLYPWGGFSGGDALFERLRTRPSSHSEILAEVFPPWRISRAAPTFLDGADAEERAALGTRFEAVDQRHPVGPATLLCRSRNVSFAGGLLYYVENECPRILHESFRPHERLIFKPLDADFERADESIASDGTLLLLDSAGSFNYGHFLIDDLPRLAALDHLPKGSPPVTILMVSYHSLIDETRRHAISMMVGGQEKVQIRFLDRNRRYHFDQLLHVTPSSQQPVLKSPHAMSALSARMRRRSWTWRLKMQVKRAAQGHWQRPRLFVDRNPVHGRQLLNRDAVLALVMSRGFEVFDPGATHTGEQAARFADAGLVVGIVGAAMTNTVFCAPGTPLLYLTPEGWNDPFYWDLAAVRGHPYAELSGPREHSAAEEHLRPFRLDLDTLDKALTRIATAG